MDISRSLSRSAWPVGTGQCGAKGQRQMCQSQLGLLYQPSQVQSDTQTCPPTAHRQHGEWNPQEKTAPQTPLIKAHQKAFSPFVVQGGTTNAGEENKPHTPPHTKNPTTQFTYKKIIVWLALSKNAIKRKSTFKN